MFVMTSLFDVLVRPELSSKQPFGATSTIDEVLAGVDLIGQRALVTKFADCN